MAPLAIAGCLVDVGREYYSFAAEWKAKTESGLDTEANLRLMRSDFRHKAGMHVVAGLTATAGASLGALATGAVIVTTGL